MSGRILLLAGEYYKRFAKPILNKEGYVVPTREPSQYAGLGRQLPDLVIQDVVGYEPEGRDSDLSLTTRVVTDIKKSGASISMLVVSSRINPQDIRKFMKVLVGLEPRRWDYLYRALSEDELLKQVREMLGR